jgi:hypothetical protein
VKTLRSRVSDLMVRIHQIPPELADYHVRGMEPGEVKRRFLFYVRTGLSRAELSVAGPRRRAGNVFPTRFSRPATMTAGRAALNPVPESRPQACQIRK